MTGRLPATIAFAGAAVFLAAVAVLLAFDAIERRDWLRGAAAIICAGLSVALGDEAFAFFTGRSPTISWLVFEQWKLHRFVFVAGFLLFMAFTGAFSRHVTNDGRRHVVLLALGVAAYAIGAVLAERWIPAPP